MGINRYSKSYKGIEKNKLSLYNIENLFYRKALLMNKTKRKIFETSMKLFAEKGYDATSVEEITAVVGVAKGTLYYHFSSKEEIFNFLVGEGMKLLRNSIEIKTANKSTTIEKLKAIILIQIKVIIKYENLISIILSQLWGTEPRNIICKKCVLEYVEMIESIIKQGLEKGDLKDVDSSMLASGIFGLTFSCLMYKLKTNKTIDIDSVYNEVIHTLFFGLENI